MHRILIVEDNLEILEVVKTILQLHGFETLASPYGEDTFVNVETFKPQLILLDQFLGMVNGADICRELKANPKTKDIPIIIFSARGNQSLDKSCNADDFIDKPFDIHNLVNRIQIQINKSNVETT